MTGTEARAGRRVLVAEDGRLLADDVARGLAAGAAEVIGPAGDVDGALGLIDGAAPDLDRRGGTAFPVADAPRATGHAGSAVPLRHEGVARRGKPVDAPKAARAPFGRARGPVPPDGPPGPPPPTRSVGGTRVARRSPWALNARAVVTSSS